MLTACAIDGDTDTQVLFVFLYEPLHFLAVVVNAVGGEIKTVGVEPVMIAAIHLRLDVVAYLVDEVYLKERLATDKVPNHALVGEIRVALSVEYIINSRLCRTPRHTLLFVLAYQIAVLAG